MSLEVGCLFVAMGLSAPFIVLPLILANGEEVLHLGADLTMFCDFTPQHGASGWSELVHTSGVAQITKGD